MAGEPELSEAEVQEALRCWISKGGAYLLKALRKAYPLGLDYQAQHDALCPSHKDGLELGRTSLLLSGLAAERMENGRTLAALRSGQGRGVTGTPAALRGDPGLTARSMNASNDLRIVRAPPARASADFGVLRVVRTSRAALSLTARSGRVVATTAGSHNLHYVILIFRITDT